MEHGELHGELINLISTGNKDGIKTINSSVNGTSLMRRFDAVHVSLQTLDLKQNAYRRETCIQDRLYA